MTTTRWVIQRKSDGMYCDWKVQGWREDMTPECLKDTPLGYIECEDNIPVRVTIEEINHDPR